MQLVNLIIRDLSFPQFLQSKPTRQMRSLIIWLILAAIGGSACFADDTPEYECYVINPIDMFGYNGAINSSINDGIKDIQDEDDSYEVAASSFESAAEWADSDDDRDFIAKNNLGCVLLKQAAMSPSASSVPIIRESKVLPGLAFIGGRLLGSFLPSTSGLCNEKLEESYYLFSGNYHDGYKEDNINFSVLNEIISKISCATPMRIVIKITRPSAPKIRLNIAMPPHVFDTISSLKPIVGGNPQKLLNKENLVLSVPLPSEGAYCYELNAEKSDSSYPIVGNGIIFIDSVGGDFLDIFFKDYTVTIDDSLTVKLIDNRESFVLYATFSNPTEFTYAEILIKSKNEQYKTIELSNEDSREVEEISLSSNNEELSYEVKINGKLINTGNIKNISDGDVFRLEVDQNSAFLQRRTCDDGELIDLDYAIEDLVESVRSGDIVWMDENMATALSLTDPQNPGISALTWHSLCWWGALSRHAAHVVDDACEMAVQTASTSMDTQLLARAHGSRGLARALTKNVDGAISDFKYYVEHRDHPEFVQLRKEWIQLLELGWDPQAVFNDEMLDRLIYP